MAFTSDRPITVDGVRLDTLAWNIEKINRATAARRDTDVALPGRDGAVVSLNDTLEPVRFGLEMFVMGTDPDGAVPAAGRRTTFWNNLDELVHLFGTRHRLLEVRETVAPGVERMALAKVTDSITPDMNEVGSSGRFTVSLVLPSGVWEDVAATDWYQLDPTPSVEVTSLQGATERIQDAILLVKGPVTNPRVTDTATGAWVELQATLGAADYWRVNVGTWATRTGNLGFGSSDTTGTDRQAVTRYGGMVNQAAFLPLTPVRDTGLRRVRLTLTGSGKDPSTMIGIRARRKYAL